MALTQTDLDRIDDAIAKGSVIQSMTFADQTFTFRSIKDMLEARAFIAGQITAAGTGTVTRYRLAATSKGA